MTRICAYHGNLYPHHARQDFLEIRDAGFDSVLLPITEQDMLHSIGNFAALRAEAAILGLRAIASPWGLGGIFGGEGVSSKSYDVDQVAALALFQTWVRAVGRAGFSAVHLDEPRPISLLPHLLDAVRGMMTLVTLTSEALDEATVADLQAIPCDYLGVSNYFPNSVSLEDARTATYNRADKLVEACGYGLIWAQGFGLARGREELIHTTLSAAHHAGVRNFGFWSYRAAAATSEIAAKDPHLAWLQAQLWFRYAREAS